MQAVHASPEAALADIEHSDSILAFGDHFLNVPQELLGLATKYCVRVAQQQLAAFLVGANGVDWITIRLLQLLVVDLANLEL